MPRKAEAGSRVAFICFLTPSGKSVIFLTSPKKDEGVSMYGFETVFIPFINGISCTVLLFNPLDFMYIILYKILFSIKSLFERKASAICGKMERAVNSGY